MNLSKNNWDSYKSALEALFLQSFGKPIAANYLDWRYRDNLAQALWFEVELSEGLPVASYSMFPVELNCNGMTVNSAMSMTTMTHPQWRGKGLFPRLAAALYERAAQAGVQMVWGFPNNNSHLPFNTKLDWKDIYEIPTLTLALGATGVGAASTEVSRDDGFDLDYALPTNDGLIRVARTRAYFQWRYARNPINRYRNYVIAKEGKVSSCLVVKEYGQELDVVDLQPATAEEARALIRQMTGDYAGRASRINCWAPTHHFVHAVLEREGFQNAAPITYFAGRQFHDAPGLRDWSNYRNWYIQMGDSDVF